jgi:transposase InsO family protein
MIPGWCTATSMSTQLVLDAVEHAIWTRGRRGVTDLGGVIHHADAGRKGALRVDPDDHSRGCLVGPGNCLDALEA